MSSFKQELAVMNANVANGSFSAARFPQTMKTGLVISLLKKRALDKNIKNIKNFRPITNLTTISKIIERLVVHRFRPHLISSLNYFRLQTAYFTGRSTKTALVKIIYDILSHINGGLSSRW